MLIDDGLVVREDGGWAPVGDLSSIAVPPSVAALLAARLERLSDEERRAIGSASVMGKVFYVGAVRELLPEADRANAGPLVRSLVRKELVRETRSTIPGEDAFEFRHILIRDAAYAAIPKERRAEQHHRSPTGASGSPATGSRSWRRSSGTTSSRRSAIASRSVPSATKRGRWRPRRRPGSSRRACGRSTART